MTNKLTKKGLIIFMGECFRESPVEMHGHTRSRDTEFGLKNQVESSLSHQKLINHLTSLEYHIDISINTYTTQFKDILLNYYNTPIYTNFSNTMYGDIFDVYSSSIVNTLSNVDIDGYSFIFLCRLDTLLKDKLIHIFNPEWKQITYANVMSVTDDGTCIADLFCFIPNKYFTPFNNWNGLLHNSRIMLHHHSVQYLIQNGLTIKDDIGFMTDRIYIANTSQLSNPLYALNNRPKGPEYLEGCNNKIYIKETHSVIDI